ncbi:hypothetical protein NCU02517 [Neurospora crassa OR74A]|uniref:Uncharacterized protein n=1 Tax=Neurospora crassa (strain ATCC 24698 / 74-OR23-1A / CBS 708.71 / DSM 1257 / FGSC 987) TaxID=367110 RepID=Q7SHU6_NEUCR|nr:hypothetical protein NCU02517 [Neurospora crassa OR74A]EAA36412.1 hypothetical protein NCU02517 [Neurospora crassa OR74A]|eukprot:XP_965648.1 hypothetical protein NCU02517 [Neurospora crassa OR74A]
MGNGGKTVVVRLCKHGWKSKFTIDVRLMFEGRGTAEVWWRSLPCEQPLGLCCRRVDLSVVPEVAVSEPSAGQTSGAERSGVFRCRVSEFRLLAPLPEQRPRRVGG